MRLMQKSIKWNESHLGRSQEIKTGNGNVWTNFERSEGSQKSVKVTKWVNCLHIEEAMNSQERILYEFESSSKSCWKDIWMMYFWKWKNEKSGKIYNVVSATSCSYSVKIYSEPPSNPEWAITIFLNERISLSFEKDSAKNVGFLVLKIQQPEKSKKKLVCWKSKKSCFFRKSNKSNKSKKKVGLVGIQQIQLS